MSMPVFTIGKVTIASCFALTMCTLGYCCVPFCLDDCKDVHHHCPECRHVLGVYKRV